MEHSPSSYLTVTQLVKFPPFMKSDGSLPCSQKLATRS